MKKIVVATILISLISNGCGWIDRHLAFWRNHSKICIEGVQYYQFSSGASVAYNRDGSVKSCN